MIVVTVALHSAVTHKTITLARMLIVNDGTSTDPKRGDYTVHVGNKKDVDDLRMIFNHPQREGAVRNYPRLSYNVWRLVSRALRSAFPEEK